MVLIGKVFLHTKKINRFLDLLLKFIEKCYFRSFDEKTIAVICNNWVFLRMFLAACSSAVLFANGTSSCEASVAVFYGSRQVERGTFSRLCCVMFVSPREWKDSIQVSMCVCL